MPLPCILGAAGAAFNDAKKFKAHALFLQQTAAFVDFVVLDVIILRLLCPRRSPAFSRFALLSEHTHTDEQQKTGRLQEEPKTGSRLKF